MTEKKEYLKDQVKIRKSDLRKKNWLPLVVFDFFCTTVNNEWAGDSTNTLCPSFLYGNT